MASTVPVVSGADGNEAGQKAFVWQGALTENNAAVKAGSRIWHIVLKS
jgi:hypothetical protein